ncbi:hypothetical protein FEZ41_02190 [Lentilactobacillus parafarraginis]|uniref:Bacterial Ig domain-containing protein n=2 Tax=Lentilactobacillus parafarraginis TaxID=390842 RepID=A0A0R1YBG1_9LACO|nr:hypothetical protein [Lentilactobacillus parafarraginis]KRM39725.1 hypothetical protein FD47_GL002993 [Lentilactobacillus parafarraginis DSM 18390 = JCM 14109]TLQ20848.1 hypothetical protein FEZ41_02190 [Lentilactobacillus parafarraginis]
MMNKLTIATTVFILASASGMTVNGQSTKQIKVQKFTERSKYISGMAIPRAKLHLKRAGTSYGYGIANRKGHFRFRLKSKMKGGWKYTLIATRHGYRTIKVVVSPTASPDKKRVRTSLPVNQPQSVTPAQSTSSSHQTQDNQHPQQISEAPQVNKPAVTPAPMEVGQSQSTMSPEFANHLNGRILGNANGSSSTVRASNTVIKDSSSNPAIDDRNMNSDKTDELAKQIDLLYSKSNDLMEQQDQASDKADEDRDDQELLRAGENAWLENIEIWQNKLKEDSKNDDPYGNKFADQDHLESAQYDLNRYYELVAKGVTIDQLREDQRIQTRTANYLGADRKSVMAQIRELEEQFNQLGGSY